MYSFLVLFTDRMDCELSCEIMVLPNYLAQYVIYRHGADKAAVAAVVTVVPHAEYIAFGNFDFVLAAVIHGLVDIRLVQGLAVAPYLAVAEGQRIAGPTRDDSLDRKSVV